MNTLTKIEDITAKFEDQYDYLESGRAEIDGSRAIAAGRAAGLAYDAGLKRVAQTIWSTEVPSVAGMPTFEQFYAGYKAHQAAFPSEFSSEKNFPIPGTSFSNAAGSYAYALDNAVRGKAALGGGHSEWAGYWGEKVLSAEGFQAQAVQLNQAILSGQLLPTVKAKGK